MNRIRKVAEAVPFPGWWMHGVRVHDAKDRRGVLCKAGRGTWIVAIDPDPEDPEADPVRIPALPGEWNLIVDHTISPYQLDAIAYDAERAVFRHFGCHYIPEWNAVGDIYRKPGTRPTAVGRPELKGLAAKVRGAILEALKEYVR